MDIRIKTTDIVMSPALSDYANKCLDKVSKTVGDDPTIQCDLELARTTKHHLKGDVYCAEIHIVGEGIDAYASVDREDLNLAINDVRDEIVHKLRSDKGKRISYVRRGGAKVKAMIKGLWPWGACGWYRGRK